MSILVKGMEMPKDCIVCPFGWNGCNHQHDFVYMGSRPDDCPLVEVPPHGRLIDADGLYKNYQEICSDIACTTCPFLNKDGCEVEQMIMYAPTIIEAEKGGKDEGPY